MDWLEGKRTYIILAVMILLGMVDGWNEFCASATAFEYCFNIEIPPFVYSLLAAMGVVTRARVGK